MNTRIALVMHLVIGSTLMGIGVTTVLSMGLDTARPILIAAIVGFVVAWPISWLVARKMTQVMKSQP